MSTPTEPAPIPEMKSLYKKRWSITLIVVLVFAFLGAVTEDGDACGSRWTSTQR